MYNQYKITDLVIKSKLINLVHLFQNLVNTNSFYFPKTKSVSYLFFYYYKLLKTLFTGKIIFSFVTDF